MFHSICLFGPLRMRAESEERPQQKSCYRPGDETGGGEEGKRRSASLPASPVGLAGGLEITSFPLPLFPLKFMASVLKIIVVIRIYT